MVKKKLLVEPDEALRGDLQDFSVAHYNAPQAEIIRAAL